MSSTSSTSAPADENAEETIEMVIPDQKAVPIPLFLKKLWKIVNDPNAEHIIGWNNTGDGFIIYDQVKFVTELLPQYFKHNNLSSFIRQLNFYDFHKVANVDKHEMEFAHSCFLKGLPETLAFITRKVPNVKSRTNQKQENVEELINGVREMKTKHSLIDSEMKMLKQENTALWNEISSLRIKYSKQTKIINKLIHFLISYMHSHQNSFSKTNITVNRKSDGKHLGNSPQLLQIAYSKVPSSAIKKTTQNLKLPGSSRTVTITAPTIGKNMNQNVYVKQKGISNMANQVKGIKGAPKKFATVSSYPREKMITDDSLIYNVTSPERQDIITYGECPYPIEEIAADVDSDIEETSVYTVKFPKNEVKSYQSNQNTDSQESSNLNQIPSQPNIVKNTSLTKPKIVVLHNTNIDEKMKSNAKNMLNKSPVKPKTLKLSQKDRKLSNLVIPQDTLEQNDFFKQPKRLKPSKLHENKINKTDKPFKQENLTPAPSPVKPEVVLENLFTELENPTSLQSMPEIMSDLPPDPNQLGLQIETNPSEILLSNDPEQFLIENQAENVPAISENLQDIPSSSSNLLSTLSDGMVDSSGDPILTNSPENFLSCLSTDQENSSYDNPVLDNDFGNYSEDVLSSLSPDINQPNSPSKELLKYNIIENPKENLGMYLDNTQIQLNNIQDLLNDLNSGEFLDLLSCFNADEEDENMDQQNNLFLEQNSLTND